MTTSTTDRPDTGTDADVIDDPPDQTTLPPFDGEEGVETNWRRIMWIIVALVFASTVALITFVVVKNHYEGEIRRERQVNALRDLNNRITTERIGGEFTRVFYVGENMRAEWRAENGLKRCVMRVNPPTDEVLRYNTSSVEADDASFKMLQDPDAIGCLEAAEGGGIGGG